MAKGPGRSALKAAEAAEAKAAVHCVALAWSGPPGQGCEAVTSVRIPLSMYYVVQALSVCRDLLEAESRYPMATPAEMVSGLTAVEKTAKLLAAALHDAAPRHGLGDAAAERQRCEQIHVFLRCIGKTSTLAENQRLLLPKDATVKDARVAMENERGGRQMRQQDVRDEDGFRFSEPMQTEPLWKFSNGCRLTLSFQDDWSKELSKDVQSILPRWRKQ